MFNTPNYNYGYNWMQNTSQQFPQSQQNGIIWVQGEAGAKSFLITTPGQSVLLMDSENNVFYIKSSDASGIPLPLRIFDYTERKTKQENVQLSEDYITRKEFEKRIAELKNNAKQSVQSTK